MTGTSTRFFCTLSSETRSVEDIVNSYCDFLKELGFADSKKVSAVFRELLVNAMFHGNQCIATRPINVEIGHMGRKYFRITVEDSGKGFDYKSLTLSSPHGSKKHGYTLIRNLSDRVEFNDTGNCITAYIEAE